MSRQHLVNLVLLAFLAASLLLACSEQNSDPVQPTAAAVTLEKTVQRPIMDFVSAQGITNYFVPPALDFMGWYAVIDDGFRLASIDYAGVSDRYLNGALRTTFAGTVTERSLPDGRAQVKVNLHTRNALVYFVDGLTGDFASGTLLFGNRTQDVAGGAEAALGDVHFEIEFINTAPGAPLPDIMWAQYGYYYPDLPFLPTGYPWPDFEYISIRINAAADGPLHFAAGLGPDGTPGHGKVVQVNLRPQAQNFGSHGDMWPVEQISLHRIP